jgi:hypothetical protein
MNKKELMESFSAISKKMASRSSYILHPLLQCNISDCDVERKIPYFLPLCILWQCSYNGSSTVCTWQDTWCILLQRRDLNNNTSD